MLVFLKEVKAKDIGNRLRRRALYKCDNCNSETERTFESNNNINQIGCSNCRKKNLKPLPNKIMGIEVVEDLGMNKDIKPKRLAIFKCPECENNFKSLVNAIKTSQKKSCGCLKNKPSVYTHLLTKHPLYRKWSGMKTRVSNSNEHHYHRYGGRGIKICDEWKNDFLSFYNWAINNGWIKGLTIDRIDNDGNYEPSNCQWITMRENTLKDKIKFNLTSKEKEYVCKMYTVELKTVTEVATIFKTHKKNISDILTKNNITIAKGNSKRCIVKQ